ncbi:hypothetical protein AB0N38_18870 [Micromonospora aurantiaca]|uniref:Uncharacterized protein n=1 Tax=Micromonospora aurantiaca (nom. illeg.) TaxID=47850 RepID=A0A6N3JTC0_9ACTN|nr:hypothetical protein [Micromonospora aurantiaca]AXH88787.1 hypothetical protein DVH21_01950 [Micromonospora aurantiaca]MBC9003687.1 hypothetical protein [Micromonospora aurantiaca]
MARSDIIHEFNGNLSGGNYAGPWIDTAEVNAVIVSWTDFGGLGNTGEIQHSVDGSTAMRTVTVGVGQEVVLPARFFRFRLSTGGSGESPLQLSIRRVR